MSFERQLARMAKGSARVQKRSAMAIAKKNRRELASLEDMGYNESSTEVAITTATVGLCYYLSGIAQGDVVDQRQGNKVSTREYNCFVRFVVDIASRQVRLILFRDMQCQGAVPAVSDVLSTANIAYSYNWNNRARFSILSDRMIHLAGMANDVEAYRYVKFRVKRRMNLEFITASEAVTGAGKGAIFLLVLSAVNGTANGCRLFYSVKYKG